MKRRLQQVQVDALASRFHYRQYLLYFIYCIRYLCSSGKYITRNIGIIPRLSVSETEEFVCTKTVFANGSIVRDCQKTYTGLWCQLDTANYNLCKV